MKVPHSAAAVVGLMLLVSGCVAPPSKPVVVAPAPKAPVHKSPSYWNGDGIMGKARIEVGLKEQRAYFYKDDNLVGESVISSGRKGFETPPGNYRVTEKDAKHVSNLYGDFVDGNQAVVKKSVDTSKEKPPEGALFQGAPMPYFLRFSEGYGLHAGKIPGYRASHGCIRLPRALARHFYEHAELGTPVIVRAQIDGL